MNFLLDPLWGIKIRDPREVSIKISTMELPMIKTFPPALQAKFTAFGMHQPPEFDSFADSVLRFMIAFDQLPKKFGSEQMSMEDLQLADRLVFSKEHGELQEMTDAWKKFVREQSLENLTEFVDGAIDSIYVICWTLNKIGVPTNLLFEEVQRSNMAKLLPDGTYAKDEKGKVMKPESWTPPDLFSILMRASEGGKYEGNWLKENTSGRPGTK